MSNYNNDLKSSVTKIERRLDVFDSFISSISFFVILAFVILIGFIIFMFLNYNNFNNKNIVFSDRINSKYNVFTCANESNGLDNIISVDYKYSNEYNSGDGYLFIYSVDGKEYSYKSNLCKKTDYTFDFYNIKGVK